MYCKFVQLSEPIHSETTFSGGGGTGRTGSRKGSGQTAPQRTGKRRRRSNAILTLRGPMAKARRAGKPEGRGRGRQDGRRQQQRGEPTDGTPKRETRMQKVLRKVGTFPETGVGGGRRPASRRPRATDGDCASSQTKEKENQGCVVVVKIL